MQNYYCRESTNTDYFKNVNLQKKKKNTTLYLYHGKIYNLHSKKIYNLFHEIANYSFQKA